MITNTQQNAAAVIRYLNDDTPWMMAYRLKAQQVVNRMAVELRMSVDQTINVIRELANGY